MNRYVQIGLASVALLAGGCGSNVAVTRYGESQYGEPGRFREARPLNGDARLVLPSAASVQEPESLAEYNFESVRRDGALAAGLLDSDLAVPYYQGERAPGLDEVRWLYLSDNPRRVTYYSTYRRDHRRW